MRTPDVRGWAAELLGPKVPHVAFHSNGVAFADGYEPVGGLARATGSLELLLPFPFVGGAHRTYIFFDSARIRSPGRRFDPTDRELEQHDWFHSTGAGLQLSTPVGPVRLGLGYKLNPSLVDLLPAGAVLDALVTGTPLSAIPADQEGRWHLHLSLGLTR